MSLSARKKLPMVAHYLFYFAGFAPVDLFMPTYARQLGFSSVMVGTVYTVLPIMGMLGTLLMSVVADKFQIHKSLLLCCISIAVVNFYCLIFVPVKNDFQVTCDEVSAIKICSSDHFKSFKINNGTSMNTSIECLADSEFLNTLCTYWNSSAYFCEDFKYLNTKHNSFNSDNKKNMEELYSLFINRFSVSKLINFDVQLSSFSNKQNGDCLTLKIEKIKSTNENNWQIPYCEKLHNSSCHIYDNLSKNTGITSKLSNVILNNFQFVLFMILMVIGWTSRVIVANLADSICCKLLGDNRNEYGTIRSWGSIGWGISALLTGFLVDYFSFGKHYKDFRPMFYLIAATFSLDLLVSTSLKETRQVHADNSIGKDMKKLFLDVRIFLFFVTCIMMGIGGSLISNFLFWYLEEIAGKNTKWIKTLEGTVACFKSLGGELPSYYFNSWLLKKVGHIHSISLVYLAYGIRYFLHSFIENPWWSIPIEILGGLTVSTLHATMVSYASLIAPLGTEATMQSIVDALYSGLGMSLGSVIGGFLMNRFHSSFVFKIYGSFAIMLCVLHFVVQSFLRKNSDEHNLLLPSSDTIQDTCEDTDGESDKECKGNEDLNFF